MTRYLTLCALAALFMFAVSCHAENAAPPKPEPTTAAQAADVKWWLTQAAKHSNESGPVPLMNSPPQTEQNAYEDPAYTIRPSIAFEMARAGNGDLSKFIDATGNQYTKVRTLLSAGEVCILRGKRDEAMKEYFAKAEKIAHKNDNPNREESLRDCGLFAARARFFPEAIECAKGIKNIQYQRDLYAAIGSKQAAAGKKEDAVKSYMLAINAGKGYCSEVVLSAVKAGLWETADKIAEGIKNKADQSIAFAYLAQESNRAGKSDEAAKYLSNAEAAAKQIEVIDTDSSTTRLRCFFVVAVQYDKMGIKKESARLFNDVLTENKKPDRALYSMVYAQAEAGMIDEAIANANLIKDASEKDSALVWISDAYAKEQKFDKAIEIMNAIKGPYDRGTALVYICGYLNDAEKYEEAQALIEKTKGVEFGKNGLELSSYEFKPKALATAGKYDEAMAACGNNPYALASIVEVAAKAGKKDEVQKIMKSLMSEAKKIPFDPSFSAKAEALSEILLNAGYSDILIAAYDSLRDQDAYFLAGFCLNAARALNDKAHPEDLPKEDSDNK